MIRSLVGKYLLMVLQLPIEALNGIETSEAMVTPFNHSSTLLSQQQASQNNHHGIVLIGGIYTCQGGGHNPRHEMCFGTL